jgi:hypothetical protein
MARPTRPRLVLLPILMLLKGHGGRSLGSAHCEAGPRRAPLQMRMSPTQRWRPRRRASTRHADRMASHSPRFDPPTWICCYKFTRPRAVIAGSSAGTGPSDAAASQPRARHRAPPRSPNVPARAPPTALPSAKPGDEGITAKPRGRAVPHVYGRVWRLLGITGHARWV